MSDAHSGHIPSRDRQECHSHEAPCSGGRENESRVAESQGQLVGGQEESFGLSYSFPSSLSMASDSRHDPFGGAVDLAAMVPPSQWSDLNLQATFADSHSRRYHDKPTFEPGLRYGNSSSDHDGPYRAAENLALAPSPPPRVRQHKHLSEASNHTRIPETTPAIIKSEMPDCEDQARGLPRHQSESHCFWPQVKPLKEGVQAGGTVEHHRSHDGQKPVLSFPGQTDPGPGAASGYPWHSGSLTSMMLQSGPSRRNVDMVPMDPAIPAHRLYGDNGKHGAPAAEAQNHARDAPANPESDAGGFEYPGYPAELSVPAHISRHCGNPGFPPAPGEPPTCSQGNRHEFQPPKAYYPHDFPLQPGIYHEKIPQNQQAPYQTYVNPSQRPPVPAPAPPERHQYPFTSTGSELPELHLDSPLLPIDPEATARHQLSRQNRPTRAASVREDSKTEEGNPLQSSSLLPSANSHGQEFASGQMTGGPPAAPENFVPGPLTAAQDVARPMDPTAMPMGNVRLASTDPWLGSRSQQPPHGYHQPVMSSQSPVRQHPVSYPKPQLSSDPHQGVPYPTPSSLPPELQPGHGAHPSNPVYDSIQANAAFKPSENPASNPESLSSGQATPDGQQPPAPTSPSPVPLSDHYDPPKHFSRSHFPLDNQAPHHMPQTRPKSPSEVNRLLREENSPDESVRAIEARFKSNRAQAWSPRGGRVAGLCRDPLNILFFFVIVPHVIALVYLYLSTMATVFEATETTRRLELQVTSAFVVGGNTNTIDAGNVTSPTPGPLLVVFYPFPRATFGLAIISGLLALCWAVDKCLIAIISATAKTAKSLKRRGDRNPDSVGRDQLPPSGPGQRHESSPRKVDSRLHSSCDWRGETASGRDGQETGATEQGRSCSSSLTRKAARRKRRSLLLTITMAVLVGISLVINGVFQLVSPFHLAIFDGIFRRLVRVALTIIAGSTAEPSSEEITMCEIQACACSSASAALSSDIAVQEDLCARFRALLGLNFSLAVSWAVLIVLLFVARRRIV